MKPETPTLDAPPTLWDHLDRLVETCSREQAQGANERKAAQKRHLQRLRHGGHAQTVLEVARALPQPFTLNDLSVACWRRDRAFFGMKGYEQHPDNHKIHTFLYGKRGLVHNGMLVRVQEGLFQAAAGGAVPEPE